MTAPPGLHRERTSLAWNRTALAMMVAGGLYVRAGGRPLHPARHFPGIVIIALGAALFAVAVRRQARRKSGTGETGMLPAAWVLRGVTAVTVLFSLASLVLILFGG